MKKALKWILRIVVALVVVGFVCFLYFIPPFYIAPPEAFSKPEADAPPSLANITDPAERALAEHGKYIVSTVGCSACHTPIGSKGPTYEKYLAGGLKLSGKVDGAFVSRNLTPDTKVGLGRRTDDQVLRVFRTGLLPEGREALHRVMPWYALSAMTEEDRHAVLAYLRHLTPVSQHIPDPDFKAPMADTASAEEFYPSDYGIAQ
ncbi:MAG TPA: c-type cytochrome [Bacteroidota bacterium]|nr:c-type cytochrome [Bacteroidota bacterium]